MRTGPHGGLRVLVVALALFPFSIGASFSQFPAGERGALEGQVRGENDRPLEGATVELAGDLSRTATTGARGRFVFVALPPGAYSVEVRLAGHVTSALDGIVLHAREVLYLPFDLRPGKETSFTLTARPGFDTTTGSSVWRLETDILNALPSAGALGPLLPLRPRPSRVGFLDGSNAEASPWRFDLPVDFLAELSVRPADVSAELDFVGGAPIHLITRSSERGTHASLRVRLAPASLAARDRTGLRTTAAAGSSFGDRAHAFGGLSRSRDQPAELDDRLDREVDFVLGKVGYRAGDSWRLDGSVLSSSGDERGLSSSPPLGGRLPSGGRDRLSKLLVTGLLSRSVDIGARADLRKRRWPSGETDLLGGFQREAEALSSWLSLQLGSHTINGGASYNDTERVSAAPSPTAWHLGSPRLLLWAENRARWANVSFRLGIRSLQIRSLPGSSSRASPRTTEHSGRASVSWDPNGNGRWSLYLNGGESLGSLYSTMSIRESETEIRRFAVGVRHQLLPGVVLEAEGVRSLRRGSEALPVVESPGFSPICAREQSQARLAVRASLLSRWDAALHYERSRTGGRVSCSAASFDDPPSSFGLHPLDSGFEPSLNDLQRLRLWSIWRGESGWHSAVVLRLEDGLAAVTRLPLDSSAQSTNPVGGGRSDDSLFQLDFSFGQSWSVFPRLGSDGLRLGARIEALNLFDSDAQIVLSPLGAASPDDQTQRRFQRARQIWLGVSLEL